MQDQSETEVKIDNVNFNCPKCGLILDHPYTCKNCKENFCKNCIQSPCYKCKKGNNKENDFVENIQLHRIIQSMIIVCDYCGKEMISGNDLKDHIYKRKCPVKIYICDICKTFHTNDLNNFWNHIKEKHKIELIKKLGN